MAAPSWSVTVDNEKRVDSTEVASPDNPLSKALWRVGNVTDADRLPGFDHDDL